MYLKVNLLADFRELLDVSKDAHKIGLNLSILALVLLDHGQFIPCSESVLQEERTTEADKLASGHDSDPITKHICLIHIVRGQQYDPVIFVILKHVPNGTSSAQIHTSGGLVEHDKTRISAKSDRD